MKTRAMPLTIEFFYILENFEIINWEAKDFWSKMDASAYSDVNTMRQKMYAAIKFLVSYEHLDVKKSPNHKELNIYSENEALRSFYKEVMRLRVNDELMDTYNQLLEEIKIKENSIKFIASLIDNHPSIKNHLNEHNKQYENELIKLKSNVNLMKDIIINESFY